MKIYAQKSIQRQSLIAIISDIHDNLVNLEKCLTWCAKQKITEIICCGDVTNSETLRFLALAWQGLVHLVKGNMEIYDEDELKQYQNIKYYGKVGRIEFVGKIIGVCHEQYLCDKVLGQGPCEIVFYGHTHKPWQSEKGGAKLVNPGTLGGTFQKATFATWDIGSNKLELKILENL